MKKLVYFIVVTLVSISILSCSNSSDKKAVKMNVSEVQGTADVVNPSDSIDTTDSARYDSLYTGWKIDRQKDELRGGYWIWYTLPSIDAKEDSDGLLNTMAIVARYSTKYGYNVYLNLYYHEFNFAADSTQNVVTVKFDNEKPIEYQYTAANDGETNLAYIVNKEDFFNHARKAENIIIEATLKERGDNVYHFHVSK